MKPIQNLTQTQLFYHKIITEVNNLAPEKLNYVFHLLHELNKSNKNSKSHILKHKAISDADAEELKSIINSEFNRNW